MKHKLITAAFSLLVAAVMFIPHVYAAQMPEASVTRGEFMNMLYKAYLENGGSSAYQEWPGIYDGIDGYIDENGDSGAILPGSSFGSVMHFTDVGFEDDYFESTGWGYRRGYINGVRIVEGSPGYIIERYFASDTALTKEQAAVILFRMATDYDYVGQSDKSALPDNNTVSQWAETAVSWLTSTELDICLDSASEPQATVMLENAKKLIDLYFNQYSITNNGG